MKDIQFLNFDDSEMLVTKLAERIGELLEKGIAARGKASLVVSGGRTPLSLFDALSELKIEWHRVSVGLVDERWVPPDQEDSNERLIREHLLQRRAALARFTGMKTPASTAQAGQIPCAATLSALPWPIDVLLLGLGEDGHTASLFPGAATLKEAVSMHSGKRCIATSPTHAPHERMTLTLPAILDSRQIILHIEGDKKKNVYGQACQDGPPEEMPIRYVLRQNQVPVSVYWAP